MKFIRQYWGLSWRENLLTHEQIQEFSKQLIRTPDADFDEETFESYTKFLDGLITDERDRLAGIEAKALQFLGQVSIVLTVLGLFAPFVLDKIPSNFLLTRLGLVIGLIVIAIFFIYSVVCALRNSNMSNFIWVKSSEDLVVQHYNKKVKSLRFEIVNDKILEYKAMGVSVNAKASNVNYAARAFTWGLVFLIIYTIFYSIVLFWAPESAQRVELTPATMDSISTRISDRPQVFNIHFDTTSNNVLVDSSKARR